MFDAAASQNATRVASIDKVAPPAEVYNRSAMSTQLPDASIDTVITSPPYGGAQKYIRTFKLELALLGFSFAQITQFDRNTLGTERVHSRKQEPPTIAALDQVLASIAASSRHRASMLSAYLGGLLGFAKELRRVLRAEGNAFVTLGTTTFAKAQLDFADIFSKISADSGLVEVCRLTDRIPSRGMITKRHRSAGVIPTETIVWLRPRR